DPRAAQRVADLGDRDGAHGAPFGSATTDSPKKRTGWRRSSATTAARVRFGSTARASRRSRSTEATRRRDSAASAAPSGAPEGSADGRADVAGGRAGSAGAPRAATGWTARSVAATGAGAGTPRI